VTDLVPWKLELAKKLGADVTINAGTQDVVAEIMKAHSPSRC